MEGIEKSLCKAIEDVYGIDELVTFTDKLKIEYEKIKEILYACDTSWSDAYRQISSMTFENYAKGVKRIPKDAPSYIKEEKDKAKKIRDNAKNLLKR